MLRQTIAATEAKNGAWWCSSRTESSQARAAPTALCATPHHDVRIRDRPNASLRRNRTRRATVRAA